MGNIIKPLLLIDSAKLCRRDETFVSPPTFNLCIVCKSKFKCPFLDLGGIDHNYALQNKNLEDAVVIAYSELTGMGVEYYTNQKGVQFYTGNMMQEKYNGKYYLD